MNCILTHASDIIIGFRGNGDMQAIKATLEAGMHLRLIGFHLLFGFKSTINLNHCFKTKKKQSNC